MIQVFKKIKRAIFLLLLACSCSDGDKKLEIDKVVCSSGPLSTRSIEINKKGECFFSGNRFYLDSISLKDNKFDCSGNALNHYQLNLGKDRTDSLFRLLKLSDFFSENVINSKIRDMDIGETVYNIVVYYSYKGTHKKKILGARFSGELDKFVKSLMSLMSSKKAIFLDVKYNFETVHSVFAPLPDCL